MISFFIEKINNILDKTKFGSLIRIVYQKLRTELDKILYYSKVPKELLGGWKNLDWSILEIPKNHKFLDHEGQIVINWKRLYRYLPEYLNNIVGKKKVIDISPGNGGTLEIMRFFGHELLGVDYSPEDPDPENSYIYKPLLNSQNIPYVIHNCSKIPYPFKDREFDLLINFGSLNFYKPISKWPKILNEFARITSETIFLGVNLGSVFEQGKSYIDNWENNAWRLVYKKRNIYKWRRKEEKNNPKRR